MSPGAPKGNTNAFKHGHYTAEAIASWREIAKLLRDARALVKQVQSEDQARAKQIGHAPQPAVWSADKERQPLPVSGDAERPLPDARRDVPGRPEG